MSPDAKEKFMEWHRGMKENNHVFNFREEILTYCRSDVDILRRCCLEFRELFCDITEIDPFKKCLTIASACNLVHVSNELSSRQHHCQHPPTRLQSREQTVPPCAEIVIVYGREKRDLHTTCPQRWRETRWSVFVGWIP